MRPEQTAAAAPHAVHRGADNRRIPAKRTACSRWFCRARRRRRAPPGQPCGHRRTAGCISARRAPANPGSTACRQRAPSRARKPKPSRFFDAAFQSAFPGIEHRESRGRGGGRERTGTEETREAGTAAFGRLRPKLRDSGRVTSAVRAGVRRHSRHGRRRGRHRRRKTAPRAGGLR